MNLEADFAVSHGWEGEVVVRLQPEIATALAKTLYRYNEHQKIKGLPIDSGWEDLANALISETT